VSARIVYDGKQFRVAIEAGKEIVKHPGSSAIVAVHEGAVVLVRQHREPAKRRLLELPAGTLEEGEDPLESAQRELEEEVGLKGGRWRTLGTYFTSPGFLDEQMHLFLAEDLEEAEQDLDDDEDVEIVRWPVEELAQRLDELEDLKTVAALLLFLRGR
jgi:ADP-ribose pyrophosphatase